MNAKIQPKLVVVMQATWRNRKIDGRTLGQSEAHGTRESRPGCRELPSTGGPRKDILSGYGETQRQTQV